MSEPESLLTGAPRAANGRFAGPWDRPGDVRHPGHLIRWAVERRRAGGLPPIPTQGIPRADPRIAPQRAPADEIRLTFVGHATVLIQLAGFNLLTDPVWSRRVSPVPWAGPARISPPGVPFAALPPLDAVLISHDHYDHLDDRTVRRLVRSHPDVRWFAPLGHKRWLEKRGCAAVELDWGDAAHVDGEVGRLIVTALPARHWTQRSPGGANRRLWCSFAVTAPDGTSVYFGGDSGYCRVFEQIGQAHGPFAAAILPIGAYEPRWFMEPQHMNPEEAVRAYQDLGRAGAFMGVHWGTFQLTDEPILEPPQRARTAWERAGLPDADLWIPAMGETRIIEVEGPDQGNDR